MCNVFGGSTVVLMFLLPPLFSSSFRNFNSISKNISKTSSIFLNFINKYIELLLTHTSILL